jgi:hypothetical protein
MSVIINSGNLIIGNGDLFLASDVSGLPSLSAYKTALAGGALGTVSGNVGAIKGTASIQIVREITQFEVGVPLLVADQTVIREGIHFKVALAELSLGTVQKQIGGGIYSTLSSAVTEITNEAHSLTQGVASPFTFGPVLLTTSTPAATANPVITLASGGVGAASVPFTATATGTGTITGSGNLTSTLTNIAIGGTAASGQVYTVVVGSGELAQTASYTAQVSDTNTLIAAGLAKALTNVSGTGVVTNAFIAASVTAVGSSTNCGVTLTAFMYGYDFTVDTITDIIFPTVGGNFHAPGSSTSVLVNYYINQASGEQLTGGGQASVTTSSLRFFHPYKDGRALMCTIYAANPVGSVTLPFEEIAYSNSELEFRAIAVFGNAAGNQLYEIYRDLPS